MKKFIVLVSSIFVFLVFSSTYASSMSVKQLKGSQDISMWKITKNGPSVARFPISKLPSGYTIVIISNSGPDPVEATNSIRDYPGCGRINPGSQCSITFQPPGTPAVVDIKLTPFENNATGKISIMHYPD